MPVSLASVLFSCADLNQDGVRDLVVGRNGALVAYSGATLAQRWQTVSSSAGFSVASQAFYAPTLSPIGIDVTNGVWALFGY